GVHAASGINYSWQTAAAKAFLHMALE
ncbi:hypothetical protein, partial [Escherichia coli]